MKIDYSKLGKIEEEFIKNLHGSINEHGAKVLHAKKREPNEKDKVPGVEFLLVDGSGNKVPFLMYSHNPYFYEALGIVDNSFAFDKENPKYKGMNKHLVFIHKLAELGFYVYRAYKKDKLETTISTSGVNGGYLIALQHPNLSPIHYEIPKDEIKEECLTSLVHLMAKTEAE